MESIDRAQIARVLAEPSSGGRSLHSGSRPPSPNLARHRRSLSPVWARPASRPCTSAACSSPPARTNGWRLHAGRLFRARCRRARVDALASRSPAEAAACRRRRAARVPRPAEPPGRPFPDRSTASLGMDPSLQRLPPRRTPAMSNKVTINRLATGVPGLDEVLGGGLPEFSFNLHRRPAGLRQDHAGAPDDVRAGHAGTPGAVLHRAGRAAAEDAALPAAVRVLRRRAGQRRRSASSTCPTRPSSGDLDAVLARIVAEVEAARPEAGLRRLVPLGGAGEHGDGQRAQRPAALHAAARHAA